MLVKRGRGENFCHGIRMSLGEEEVTELSIKRMVSAFRVWVNFPWYLSTLEMETRVSESAR